jgi:hypothetical protein
MIATETAAVMPVSGIFGRRVEIDRQARLESDQNKIVDAATISV